MRIVLLFAFGVVLLFVGPSVAEGCEPTTSAPAIAAGSYYLVYDNCPCGPFSLWVYEESNAFEGLQRRDEVVDDTCRGAIDGDTILL